MDNTQQQQQQQQGGDANKVLNAFTNTIEKLTAIVNGPENLKEIKKVPQDAVQSLVEDLFKEERETTAAEVKNDLRNLLKNYITLNNTLNEERKKLDALEITKKKEFNTAANKLFARIDGLDVITREYSDAFKTAAESISEE